MLLGAALEAGADRRLVMWPRRLAGVAALVHAGGVAIFALLLVCLGFFLSFEDRLIDFFNSVFHALDGAAHRAFDGLLDLFAEGFSVDIHIDVDAFAAGTVVAVFHGYLP